jgi:hypothetical protein
MSNAIDIGRLSREEKLRIMEAIWEDLSRDQEQIESPEWHRELLEETERRRQSGQEGVVDWPEAKEKLRERFK